jgi:hypothetical protein
VLLNKINTTHLNATNYWTPLQSDENKEDEETEEVNKYTTNKNPNQTNGKEDSPEELRNEW